jgi:murein DD-endopeptidase MepM/ murein hydrolase activator NlpD
VGQAAVEQRQPASADGTAIAEATQQELPIFFEHEVQAGETVSSIAQDYGISPDHIVWNNIDILDDADALAIGTVLQVPSVEGMIHAVRVGETVSEIAERYDAEIAAIVEFAANGFAGNADNVQEGSLILVPGGRYVPPPPPQVEPAPEATPEATAEPETADPEPAAPLPSPEPESTPEPAPEADAETPSVPAGQAGWLWPATGRITNLFGPRHPLGIDISMVVGTPIAAASAGQAVFVGGNPCCSYGSHIIIDHGDGRETLYAHLDRFAVGNGEWVEAGQVIGWSGSSGRSTGPHLHFEVRHNGAHENPMDYLQ